jgi:hypothetical protein
MTGHQKVVTIGRIIDWNRRSVPMPSTTLDSYRAAHYIFLVPFTGRHPARLFERNIHSSAHHSPRGQRDK